MGLILQMKYENQLFDVCSEGSGDADILNELKNHGVDFNGFNTISMT